MAVYLTGNQAKNCNTHWCGGPDFAVEFISDDDASREKIPFYTKVATRELLIIDRDPWSLELFRLAAGELRSVSISTLESNNSLDSDVFPLVFRLLADAERPTIQVTDTADGRTWNV